jgi:hypothetical protein
MASRVVRRRFALLAIFGVALLLAPFPRLARAEGLTKDELAALARGEVVKRSFDLDLPQGDYIGGLGYVIIPAPPAEVMAALLDPASYEHIFPLTLEAGLVGRDGDDFFIHFRQGGRRISGEYTVRARRETPSLVRFWLDPSRPHDIADCWGFFRADPAEGGRTLLSYGALLHLEFGVMKLLFQEQIRSYALEVPGRLRSHVEERRGARAGR